eukprot:4208597-Prorocentrum_lima.AAC.1
MVVHSGEHVPMNTHGLQQAAVTCVGAINTWPMIALDQSLIPQDLHLQICFRTRGNPVVSVIQY